MRKILFLCSLIMLCLQCTPRENQNKPYGFWGDSTLTIIASNHPEGYDISIFKTDDLCILHLQRGDSINRYIALHALPESLMPVQTSGTLKMNLDIPTKTVLGGDVFFMDVNFDGEKEFVVEHEGYNRFYYACFDLVHGSKRNSCPGFLEPLGEEPFNNLVGECYDEVPCSTTFDYDSKTITIDESIGCCRHVKTIATYCDLALEAPSIRVVHQEIGYFSEGGETKEIYDLIDGALTLTRKNFIPFED